MKDTCPVCNFPLKNHNTTALDECHMKALTKYRTARTDLNNISRVMFDRPLKKFRRQSNF